MGLELTNQEKSNIIEITINDKVFELTEIKIKDIEPIFTKFLMDFKFDKMELTRELVKRCNTNDIVADDEDIYYISESSDELIENILLNCKETLDDKIIEYDVEGKKLYLKVPDWQDVKAVREYSSNSYYDNNGNIDVYSFVKGRMLINTIPEIIDTETGDKIYSDVVFMTDVKYQLPVIMRYIYTIKNKTAVIKKK